MGHFFPRLANSDFNSPIIAPLNETGLAGRAGPEPPGGGGRLPGGPPGGGGRSPGGPPGGRPPGGPPGEPPGLTLSVAMSLFMLLILDSKLEILELICCKLPSVKSVLLSTIVIIFSIISPNAVNLSSKGSFFASFKKLMNSSANHNHQFTILINKFKLII